MSEFLAKIDRLQQSLRFKIVATVIVLVVGIGLVVTAGVRNAAGIEASQRAVVREAPTSVTGDDGKERELTAAEKAAQEQLLAAVNAEASMYNRLMDQQFSTSTVAIGVGLGLLPVLASIWLGLGLTYLGLVVLAGVTALPLWRYGSPTWSAIGVFIGGAIILAGSFSALTQILRFLLSSSTPVTAIARNLVAEAVRMKISLVFIVALILGLAALPLILDADAPLRYRVQSFLQYGSWAAYYFTAIMVIFLVVASIAFEQRDKIIWQTMTKPVKAWQYILGKWLGVMGVAAVLLGVGCAGVFVFTEYLRRTSTAVDELAPYVSARGPGTIAEDRLVLDSQILVGRVTVRPVIPADLGTAIENAINERYEREYAAFDASPATMLKPDRKEIRKDIEGQALAEFLGVAPGQSKRFEFHGLEDARKFKLPLTFRYKVNAGSNNPTDFYKVSFLFEQSNPFSRSVPLGQTLTMPVATSAIIQQDTKEGAERFIMPILIANGDFRSQTINKESISFAPDGLELSYPVSSFQANFFRVTLVMWLKIGMLAMIAACTATFLSFPVACLVSFGTFIIAESASYILFSLEYFGPVHENDGYQWWRLPFVWIATPISRVFEFFSTLDPMGKLVEGQLVSWTTVGTAVGVLGLISLIVGSIAAAIFQRRELATYSGQ